MSLRSQVLSGLFSLVFLVNLRRMLPLVGLKLSAVLMAIALLALAAAGMYVCVGIAQVVELFRKERTDGRS